MLTRRRFLQLSATLAAGLALPLKWVFDPPRAYAFSQSPGLQKFIQPLRGVGPGAIPVAVPDGLPAPVTGVAHYTIDINEYTDTLHPNLGGATHLWGYNPRNALGVVGVPTQKHLGGIIVAQKGVPIQITFTNNLPDAHILPVDTSVNFDDAKENFYRNKGHNAHNATSTHLHGGYVPWISDGGPMSWFTPDGYYGPSIANDKTVPNPSINYYKLLNPGLQPGQAEYYYPNAQSARLMWYHDHAHDLTRLNAYSGIASAYILRDSFESSLKTHGLPEFIENGGNEIPIVIQDKIFVGSDIGTQDPAWNTVTTAKSQTPGSLWYPHTYDPARWTLDPRANPPGAPTDPSVVPEMFGDTMLANGTVFPEATVQARRYRIRLVNACQARVLNLQLYIDDGSADGITLAPVTLGVPPTPPYYTMYVPQNAKGPNFFVLGTEGGFLSKPTIVPSNVPFNPFTLQGSLITAPAERWDMIIDFTGYAGKKIILYNDAPAPFPGGDDINDYFPGNPNNPTNPNPGFGPNTRQIMRFNVTPLTGAPDPTFKLTTNTDLTPGIAPSLVNEWSTIPVTPPSGVPVRVLTLNEVFDQNGRLIQMLGTNQPTPLPTDFTMDPTTTDYPRQYGRGYMDPATENPTIGSVEVWQFVNLTGDTHPIHFHLGNVQVLSRQPFSGFSNGVITYHGPTRSRIKGPARGADELELGWKETVKMHPGEVTTVIMKFDMPGIPGVQVPKSLNPNLGVSGYEYVWHCHILEHEEHDMMRPMVVVDSKTYLPFITNQ